MQLDNIEKVKETIAFCLHALHTLGYMKETEMEAELRRVENDEMVTIPLYAKPDPSCPICEAIHGEYRDINHALDILQGPNGEECKQAARQWLTERIGREKDEDEEQEGTTHGS